MIFNLPSPIPATITDPEELQRFFRDTDIVPYYGTTEASSHGMLDLLTTLCEVSPTFQAVRQDLEHYSFGQSFRIRQSLVPGIEEEQEQPVERAAAVAYIDALQGMGLSLAKLLEVLRTVDGHMDICGNGWLLVRRVQTPDGGRYEVKTLHYKHCAYIVSKDPGESFIIYSKHLGDLALMAKYPPLIVRGSEQDGVLKWTQSETMPGVEETIVHLWRNSANDESDYYARPRILSVLWWLFTDFQIGNLTSKISATDLTAKFLAFFMAPDPNRIRDIEETREGQRREITEDGRVGQVDSRTVFQQNMGQLKLLTSNLGAASGTGIGNKGEASVFAGIEYPYGGTAPTVVPLEANRDTVSHKWQKEQAEQAVCSALGWSLELAGLRQTRTQMGGNMLFDMLVMKDTTTIAPRQKRMEDVLNNLLVQMAAREGVTGMDELELALPNVVGAMITRINEAKGTTGSSTGVSQAAVPSEQIPEINDDGPGT